MEIFTPDTLGSWQSDPAVLDYVLRKAYECGVEPLKAGEGEVATYIPELARADRDAFGLAVMMKDGTTVCHGDVTTRFTMQSVSKVVSLAMALKRFDTHEVFSHVLMEPSGDSFSSIIKLDTVSNLPYNPLINAGALQIIGLLATECGFDDLLDYARRMCMDDQIDLNEAVYLSEKETGDRNRAIAYLLQSKGVLPYDPEETLDLYFKMCSLDVNAVSLAGLGLVLANDGQNPLTGEHLFSPQHARCVNSIMFTCGMYDRSGEFAARVGIPAKSGVGGGITCGVRGRLGIGVYGPALDDKGNSVAGFTALEYLSRALHLHAFDYHPYIEDEVEAEQV